MLMNRERNLRLAGGAALAAATFALYLATMPPTLTFGWRERGASGGELLAAAETLGIPHPPGYPTYTLLLKGFAAVAPAGDFAFRGNLLSVILAAASVVAVYWVVLRVCRTLTPRAPEWFSLVPAALAGAVFAAAPVVWSQAVVTGVHALNAAFVGFLLLVAVALALPQPFVGTRGRWRQRLLLAAFGVLTGTGSRATTRHCSRRPCLCSSGSVWRPGGGLCCRPGLWSPSWRASLCTRTCPSGRVRARR